MIKYKYFLVAVCFGLAATLQGCYGGGPVQAASTSAGIESASEKATPEEPDPEGAIEAVYAQEAIKDALVQSIDQERMKEILVNPDFAAEEFYARYSDPRNGLADVIIAKPLPGDEETLYNWLYRYQERRVAEFENYDILDSHAIAQDAVVYHQGGYVVLLMLPDNESAQYIIDQYIPQ